MRADALVKANDVDGAVGALRAGLAEDEILKTLFAPELELRLRVSLSHLLAGSGRTAEAKAVAQPICAPEKAGRFRGTLDKAHLCE
jgi:hypothetical protein